VDYGFGSHKAHNTLLVAYEINEVMALQNVHLGDDSIVRAIGMDSIVVEVIVKGKTKKFRIEHVLHVPKLQSNVLLVSKLLS